VSSFHFAPPRPTTLPVIAGLAGPSKSGKTFSGLRLATGLAGGGQIAFINAEGARGHLYSNLFQYVAVDLTAPYRPERYTEALKAAIAIEPAVIFIDSMSHMHDGPGGLLEYKEDEVDRLAGANASQKDRDKRNAQAWIKPKAAENEFLYTLLSAVCHVVLAFRAKEKLEWRTGGAPKELGWQPIASDRVTFETLFTLMLPPHSNGVPDLKLSDMRTPFDTLIPPNKQLSEDTGRALAEWAKGSEAPALPREADAHPSAPVPPGASALLTDEQRDQLDELVREYSLEQLIATLARDRGIAADQIAADAWPTLREKLTAQEADSWLARLGSRAPAGAAV
jgi:hypothetical protein